MGIQGQSGSGEIGRHTILRGWRRKAWGFKSPLPHQDFRRKQIFRPMDFVYGALLTVHVIVCIFIVIVVLLQSGKGADVAATFSMSSQTAFGPRGAATA